ncbi:AI-2E family transporter [Mucilaginibacter myungsuensis]|uniref:AI-2E family transporter n=1 Tax=Mucilaginibacter myungsuensis TaxID=649104 RepID=A0A929KTC1_9SPHI|nr:AI-2E family transporter [Mucilaginibacter myungsuensis]MBE9660422.1 AI-2E family transporter [Mucilaginibacter myungsuensis]MDN3600464.1 AI-2E family transporter [Mucilaginibacter myungsuensis]
MPIQPRPYLNQIAQLIFVLMGATAILYFSQCILVPILFSLVLALLLLPLCRKIESIGSPKALAATIGILLLITVFAVIFFVLYWQLSQLIQDSGQMRDKIDALIKQVQQNIDQKFGLPPREQKKIIEQSNGNVMSSVSGVFGGLFGILVDIILVLVYIFLLLVFRSHLLTGLLKAVPDTQRENVRKISREAAGVSQQYLLGLAMMIGCLWVMYGIGFSLIGVKYAIFFAVLCGTLELIPFIGNLTGTILTVGISLVQGASLGQVGGIVGIYAVVQFTQSYMLEPMIVGRQVNLNPLTTILCIVVFEAIWGVPGMVLAVPLTGMFKIACDHFEQLKPYGFLLGEVPKTKKAK